MGDSFVQFLLGIRVCVGIHDNIVATSQLAPAKRKSQPDSAIIWTPNGTPAGFQGGQFRGSFLQFLIGIRVCVGIRANVFATSQLAPAKR